MGSVLGDTKRRHVSRRRVFCDCGIEAAVLVEYNCGRDYISCTVDPRSDGGWKPRATSERRHTMLGCDVQGAEPREDEGKEGDIQDSISDWLFFNEVRAFSALAATAFGITAYSH